MSEVTNKENIKEKTNEEEIKTDSKPKRTRKQSSAKKVQETESKHEDSKGIQSDKQQVKEKEVDISPFVSNLEGNVYAISNLPEEFIATLFAWVSRSPKSFKEHLKEAVKDFNIQAPSGKGFDGLAEKAKKFHEKWTVDYGHSSVAENAVAHVGIEKISRLASSELELSNQFLSLTEYSQRYQKPERGGWHNPISIFKQVTENEFKSDNKHKDLHAEFEIFMNKAFDAFDEITTLLHRHLCIKEDITVSSVKGESKEITRKRNALMKLAFEDARYVLPLSMHTQLGMTANGRAWRDALANLGNSDHNESVQLANDIRTEVTKVLPILLKYASPSQYQINSKKRMKKHFNSSSELALKNKDVQLQSVLEEGEIINKIVSLLNQSHTNSLFGSSLFFTKNMNKEEKEHIIKDLLHEMAQYDQGPDVLKHITYHANLLVSEANWHQLLRHNRKTEFTYSKPSPNFGVVIPPRVIEAGLEDVVKQIAEDSKELYNNLVEEGFETEAEYVVLNAHKRQVYMSFSLWEAYHLINLRTSEEAQWDIQNTFNELYDQLKSVHPLLMSQAKRRQ